MKVALLLDDRLDVADGVQQYVKTLGSWLTEAGHEVHYLVGEAGEDAPTNVFGLSRTAKIRFNRNRMRVPFPVRKRRVRKFLAEQNYDVIHVQMPYAPWMAGRVIAAAPRTTAVVGTFHVVVGSRFVFGLSRLIRLFTFRSARRIHRAVAVSGPAQEYMVSYLGKTGTIIPNAIRNRAFSGGVALPSYADNKPTVVFLGRLVERKGAELLVAAFSHLKHEARLVIAGDGPLRGRLEQSAKAQQNEIIFAGYIEEKDKSDYLKTADIAIFPSSGGESFGIVLIEAMAAGAGVVLAGDNPGYRSVMQSIPEAIVSSRNAQQLAQQLDEYIADQTKRELVRKKQALLVKSFDIDVVGPKIISEYKAALRKTSKMT